MFITNDVAVTKPYAPEGTVVKNDFIPSVKVDADGSFHVKIDQPTRGGAPVGFTGAPIGLPSAPIQVASVRLEELLFDSNRLLARLIQCLDDSKLDQDDLYQYLA